MKKLVTIIGVTILAALVLTTAAFASGAGAVSYTQTFQNATQTFPFPNPCTGAPGMITLTYNGVFHVTQLTSGQGAGTMWATGTETGTFAFTPFDPSQPSYTGHFTTWFGDNNNLQNGTETSTLSLRGTGSDGSVIVWRDVQHLSVSATGITVSFDKMTCN